MAGKSVLELAVETGQWTGGLKKAQSALQTFTQSSGGVAAAIAKDSEKMAKFVSQMGNMESKAKTAGSQLQEMTKVYKELAVQYRQLNDEQKNSAFGKALGQSVDQLRGRILKLQTDVKAVNDSLGTNGGGMANALEQMAGKLGLPITMLSKMGVAIGAVSAALKVAKDAFMNSESNVDAWGATVEQAKASYSVFLDTLNGGNWSNFFDNLKRAIGGAKELYEVLDRLDTVKGTNAAAIAIEQQEIQRLRKAAKEGQDVTEELKVHTDNLARLQRQGVDAGMDAGRKTMSEAITNTMSGRSGGQADNAAIDYAINQLLTRGIDALDEYKTENDKLFAKGQESKYSRGTDGVTRFTGTEFNIDKLNEEEQARYNLTKAIIESEAEWRKGIATYSAAVSEGASSIKEEIKADNYGGTKTGGKEKKGLTMEQDVALTNREVLGMLDRPREGKGYVSVLEEEEDDYKELYPLLVARRKAIDDINAKIAEMNNVLALSTDAGTKAWATDQLKAYTDELNRLNGVMDETGSKMDNFQTGFSAVQNIWGGFANSVDMVSNCIDTMTADAEENASAWQVLSSVIDTSFGVMNSVLGVIQAINTVTELSTALKTANTAATIADTAATIADTTATATHTSVETADAAATATSATAEGADAAAKAGKAVSWIPIVGPVLAVAAIAAVAAGIAASRSKTEYHADGGFVGMQARGTDTVPAMLTPGELVLNRAQQNNLAGQLAGSASTHTVVVTGRISGKDILLAADNTNRSRGGSRGYYAKTH